jgi:hypothetical protein
LHTEQRDRADAFSTERQRLTADAGHDRQVRSRRERGASVGEELQAGRTFIVIVGRSGVGGVGRVTLEVGGLGVSGVCVVCVAVSVFVVVGVIGA